MNERRVREPWLKCSLFSRLYPDANITRLAPWSHFNCSFSCSYILDPRDPLFLQIGSLFLSLVMKHFGTDHIYNTDTFNEMNPPSSDPAYLSAVSSSVFSSMTAGRCLDWDLRTLTSYGLLFILTLKLNLLLFLLSWSSSCLADARLVVHQ